MEKIDKMSVYARHCYETHCLHLFLGYQNKNYCVSNNLIVRVAFMMSLFVIGQGLKNRQERPKKA